MLVELFLEPIFLIIKGTISFIPDAFQIPNWALSAFSLISKGLYFFPIDVWRTIIANVSFWLGAQLVWSIIEWVYKKVPGVD